MNVAKALATRSKMPTDICKDCGGWLTIDGMGQEREERYECSCVTSPDLNEVLEEVLSIIKELKRLEKEGSKKWT